MRAATAFLLAAGLAVPALAVAPAAHAADPTVTRVGTDDNGRLTVGLDSADALWVKVSVRASAAADAPVLASTDALDYASGSWVTADTVALPAGTAYGDYPVDVDYRLKDGTVQHWAAADHPNASDLNYRLHAGVSALTFDRDTLDYDHQSTVASGTVTALDPATGTTGPAKAGTTVEVDYESVGGTRTFKSTATVTGDAGGFQVPLTLPFGIQGPTAKVVSPAADTTARPLTWWYAHTPAVVTTRYRIDAQESRTRVNAGVPFTESGSVERYVDGTWQPWAGAAVSTATNAGSPDSSVWTGVLGHGTTGADGGFAYDVTAARTGETFTLIQQSVYLATPSTPGEHIAVPTAGSLTTPAMSIDQYGTLTASGQLKGACDYEPLVLEHSADGRTGWTTLQWFSAYGGSYNGTCSYRISKSAYYDGYYRVRHPETDIMQPVATAAKRVYRLRTYDSVTMSSTSPRINAKLTAYGTVSQFTSAGWKPYAHVHVVLVFRPRGDGNWYWTVKGYTDSSGRYWLNTQAFGPGTWATYIEPDSAHYYSESRTVYVNAH